MYRELIRKGYKQQDKQSSTIPRENKRFNRDFEETESGKANKNENVNKGSKTSNQKK